MRWSNSGTSSRNERQVESKWLPAGTCPEAQRGANGPICVRVNYFIFPKCLSVCEGNSFGVATGTKASKQSSVILMAAHFNLLIVHEKRRKIHDRKYRTWITCHINYHIYWWEKNCNSFLRCQWYLRRGKDKTRSRKAVISSIVT